MEFPGIIIPSFWIQLFREFGSNYFQKWDLFQVFGYSSNFWSLFFPEIGFIPSFWLLFLPEISSLPSPKGQNLDLIPSPKAIFSK